MVAPAPGITPMKKPWSDWRPITGAISFASLRVIRRFEILPPSAPSRSERLGLRTRYKASGKAKSAMARVMKLIPLCRSRMPNVKRGALNNALSPTVARITPSTVIISALAT